MMLMVFVTFKHFWNIKIKLILTSLKEVEKSIVRMWEFSVKTGGCSLWYYMQRGQSCCVLRIKSSYATKNIYLDSYDG